MKKILLIALTFGAFSAMAQKDISCTMTTPAEGSSISAGVGFDVTFTVTNTGTVALASTDSVYFDITVEGNSIFQNGFIYWAQTATTALAPGASYNYTYSDVFNTIPGAAAGPHPMCVDLFLFEGTSSTPLTEGNMTNNEDCNTVTFVAGTAGINDVVGFDKNISMYPNPATDVLTFSTEGATATTIKIFNFAGQVVDQIAVSATGTTTYNVSTLEAGLYVVSFEGKNGKAVRTEKLSVK